MDCHSPPRFALTLAYVACVALVVAASAIAADPPPEAPVASSVSSIVRAMRNDAALNSTYFISPTVGWTVGDRGVIWHTDDGGTTWREQPSNVACQLNAVFFIDDQRGWAVGGESRPLQRSSRGVVLRTWDGGASWTEIPRLILPRLKGVKFFDAGRGVAFGESSSFQPAGVFTTRDGGNSWQPLTADAAGDWSAGDFVDPEIGAVGGDAGQIATLARHQLVHSPLAAASLRSFRAMRLVAPTTGWAVGDGGLVFNSRDLGRSWQTPTTELPAAIADNFDFHAVAVQGTHVWIAGSPGTRVFHSPDDGQTWESIATGQTAPLRALVFIDEQHGWAAGDLGNILATRDGGRTWRTQRTGGQRAALLALFATPTDVPLELLAESGAADGYITAVNILTSTRRVTLSETTATDDSRRSEEALLLSGAASANTTWRFPLPSADLALAPADLIAALNRESDGQAIKQLQKQLVRQLRMWRPDVVVTHHDHLEMSEPLAALVEQLVAQAVTSAADESQATELATDVGLPPWQVKKVYGLLPAGSRGDELLATGRFSPWLGAALSDYVAPARRLLYAEQTLPPDSYELKALLSNVADAPGDNRTRGLFTGISLAPGSDCRRPQAEIPTQDLDALRQVATRRRHVQELLERSEGNAAWAGQISSMIDGLAAADGGPLLVQLADGYRKAGRLDLAADTYFLFARRYPDHPLADSALEWLVKFYASSEVAHRLKIAHNVSRGEVAAVSGEQPPIADTSIRQASATIPLTAAPPATTLSRDDRLRRGAQLANYLEANRPALYAEPSVRFAETAAQRELGYANPAQRFFLTLKQLPDSNPWRECAATEEWLAQPADMPPAKKLANCRRADQPPNLDGDLNESFWSTADRLRLSDASNSGKQDAAPTVQITHDNQYLYIAIRCPKSANLDYSRDNTPRTYDSDLRQHDRVTIEIDTDRDYTTAFEFTIDSRGWTNDACWGDATWNPSWYVAAGGDDASWSAEAAVPLAQLVDKPPTARQVWAVSARRTVPRVGYQAWSGPPDATESPDRFGLLIFE